MDYFFVFIFGFAAGALAWSLTALGWGGVYFIFVLALSILLLWFFERMRLYVVAALFLCAAGLGGARTLLVPQTLPPSFESLVGTTISFEAEIVADPDIRDGSQRVIVRVEESGEPTRILAVAPLYPKLAYGENVLVSGTLEEPESFDGESGRVFRYDRFLAKDGIFGIVQQAHVEVTAKPSGVLNRIPAILFSTKHTFIAGLEAALPEPSAALAGGLLVGGKQGLGKELTDAFTTSGLIAIVVLSGYNVMIVADAVMRALSFLPKRIALSAGGAAILAFVLAAGAGASALRAGLMACLGLFARATGRTYDAARGLFFVLFLMLLWNPLSLAYDPGFELSFVATLGLIFGTPLVEKRLLFIGNEFIREIAATTIAAQVAVLPLLLYQTGNLSLVSLPANLLVLPFIPIAMAFSFGAGLVGILLPTVAPVFGIPAYLFLSYIIAVGKYAAELPFAHVILPAFPLLLTVIAYVGLWWLIKKLQ